MTIRTQPRTKADLLQRRIDINSELRAFRNKYDRPGAVEVPGDLERIEALAAERDQVEVELERTANASRPAYDRVARVGMEERTYRPDAPGGRSGTAFLWDVVRATSHADPGATERLSRHQRETEIDLGGQVARAAGTGAFAGSTVPQYLTDLYAPATATLRPLANNMSQHPLPEAGMSLNISRITTATSVALQSTENTAVSETNIDDTLLSIPIQTAAGQQTVSRQAIERGTGIEDVTLQDLFRRCASTLDATIITQASTGLEAVAQGTTYTSASPTAAEFWPFIFQAQSKLESALLGQAVPDLVVMHSRRWNWLCSQVGTSWPFLGAPGNPSQSGGVIVSNDYATTGVRGVLSNGLKVIVDNNVSTSVGGTQDEVFVCASGELHMWEDANAPLLIRAEQPLAASLGVLLVVYEYFGFTASRYGNNPGRITGTGLAAPAGF